MSSSNAVRLTAIEETTYGVTPAGAFNTVRYTQESLSGSPTTTQSNQIRTDRMSSGQIVTGLDVGGGINFELAKEAMLELMMASAMNSAWATQALVTVALSLDATAKTIDRATGTWTGNIAKGDFITLAGFVNAGNNIVVQVAELVDADTIRYVGPKTGMVTEVGTTTTYKRFDKLVIGTTPKSFTMEKYFSDTTTKAINYRGMIAATMDLSVQYGDLITGSFGMKGNGYEAVSTGTAMATNGHTINPAATTPTFNGSIDMPFLSSEATGIFDSSAFCIQSLGLSLDNNANAQNCIGNAAPEAYTLGTAAITVNLSSYLKDTAWGLLTKKLDQSRFALGFLLKNSGGSYGFYMPSVQVSFDDPQSGGANQDVTLDMQGTASVGASGESSLVIYRPN